MRALGYIRVSTEEQAREGVSLQAQEARLRAYCDLYEVDLVRVVVDAGASGKSLARPGLQEVLRALEAGEADALIVVSLDRLTRSVRDLGWLLDPPRFGQRWSLLSVQDRIDTTTASGRLVLHVMASVSQWEREAIGERTRAALRHLQSQGVRLGQDPYGARPEEEETLRLMLHWRDTGVSQHEITRRLNESGLMTRGGTPWQRAGVQRILRRHPRSS